MYEVLANGQVMKKETGLTYERWIPIGMLFETEEIKNEAGEIVSTTRKKFNIETGQYEVI